MLKEIRELSDPDLMRMKTSAERFQRDLQKTANCLFSSASRHMVSRTVNHIAAQLFNSGGSVISARGRVDDSKQIVPDLRIPAEGDFNQRKKKGVEKI